MKDTLKNMKWCSAKNVASGTVGVTISTIFATSIVGMIDFAIVSGISLIEKFSKQNSNQWWKQTEISL